jgi:vitamin-K-epoxide reductase (warfarin-sensitive)
MRYFIMVLAVAGIIVSALALPLHYSTTTAPCDVNALWDCGTVNRSSFSTIAHIPVAVFGIAGYLLLGCLGFARQRFATFIVTCLGFLFAFRLSMIEQYALGAWCVYCAISQAIITLILLLSLAWFIAEYLALKRAARKIDS